jgi:hypothetical protein
MPYSAGSTHNLFSKPEETQIKVFASLLLAAFAVAGSASATTLSV